MRLPGLIDTPLTLHEQRYAQALQVAVQQDENEAKKELNREITITRFMDRTQTSRSRRCISGRGCRPNRLRRQL
jgi:hypothetical protein